MMTTEVSRPFGRGQLVGSVYCIWERPSLRPHQLECRSGATFSIFLLGDGRDSETVQGYGPHGPSEPVRVAGMRRSNQGCKRLSGGAKAEKMSRKDVTRRVGKSGRLKGNCSASRTLQACISLQANFLRRVAGSCGLAFRTVNACLERASYRDHRMGVRCCDMQYSSTFLSK